MTLIPCDSGTTLFLPTTGPALCSSLILIQPVPRTTLPWSHRSLCYWKRDLILGNHLSLVLFLGYRSMRKWSLNVCWLDTLAGRAVVLETNPKHPSWSKLFPGSLTCILWVSSLHPTPLGSVGLSSSSWDPQRHGLGPLCSHTETCHFQPLIITLDAIPPLHSRPPASHFLMKLPPSQFLTWQ